MFSKACEYAIRSCIYVASISEPEGKVPLQAISNAIDSPPAYTAKLLQMLVQAKILNSSKGVGGGFSMDRFQLQNTLLADVVKAIDGEGVYTGCALGLMKCSSETPCSVHHQFEQVRNDLKKMLTGTRVVDLVEPYNAGITRLKQ